MCACDGYVCVYVSVSVCVCGCDVCIYMCAICEELVFGRHIFMCVCMYMCLYVCIRMCVY